MSYKCKFCGNDKYFIEHNLIATEVEIVEGQINIIRDGFLDCLEVVCAQCCEQIIKEEKYVD